MKRKIRGSGSGSVDEIRVTGEEAYQALDALKKRNSQDRGGRDPKAMSKLQPSLYLTINILNFS